MGGKKRRLSLSLSSSSAIHLGGGISNLTCRVGHFLVLFLVLVVCVLIAWGRVLGVDQLLDDFDGSSGTTGLSCQDLAVLVDDKDAPGGALGRLLEANGGDEGLGGVAEQCVGQLLLGLEGRVGLGAVGRKTIDGEAGSSEGRVRVAEETHLCCAWRFFSLALVGCHVDAIRATRLTSRGRGLGVREQHHAALALLYKLRKRRLVAIVGLDVSAKGSQVNCVADLGLTARRSRRGAVGLANNSLLDGLDLVGDGVLDLFGHGFVALGLFGLCGGLLLCWRSGRGGRRLALPKLDRHGGRVSRAGVAVASVSRGSITLGQGRVGQWEARGWAPVKQGRTVGGIEAERTSSL